MNHHIPKKGSQSPDSRANPIGASKTDLSTESISSAQARNPSRKKGPDNSPRRSHNPESPRAYPGFRDHLIDHLRAQLSLSEIASARLSDLSISPPQVTIGTKQITSPTLADLFDTFLNFRSQLAQALPALTQSDAYLFPALDGGPLLVSHRPKGMLSDGLKRFVETRDTLIDFILPFVNES